MGVTAVRAGSGSEAAKIISTTPIHLAIVDLSIPLEPGREPEEHRPGPSPEEGGRRILQLLSRLDAPPPTLVVKARRTKREDARALQAALTAGAFAVLDRPVNLETLLNAMGRALRRHYADRWPDS
jgi:DNA-binding response OmpR family regulator